MTSKISILAIDLAKGTAMPPGGVHPISFQVCAVGSDGTVLFNRALSRKRLAALLGEQQACVVAMEACATSHHWGRVAQSHGHEVRLVPAAYVKPFVKRQKNDRADAEAIAEAAMRPTMRFVAVKSAETQGRAVAFRTHQCLVRQRTQLINALRGHLAEFGLVAPKGPASLKLLENALADESSDLPDPVREMGAVYLEQIARLTDVIERLANELESQRRDGTFEKADFAYDAEHDVYTCPGGKALKQNRRAFTTPRENKPDENGMLRYRASKADCDACALKARCCPKAPSRKVLRSIYEPSRDRARAIALTTEYAISCKLRKKVEMLFAHLKRILGLNRLRLRGPCGARDEFHLAATAQNLRKLAKLLPPRQIAS